VGGADPIANAAGVAQAVFPAVDAASRPKAVTIVDSGDWRAGIAASALFAQPVGAPILLSDGTSLPAASSSALKALAPTGSKAAGGAQIIRVGDVAQAGGLTTTDVKGANPFALGRAIDAFLAAASGKSSDRVIVASADKPAFAMPAAGYAAKTGNPVLFVNKDSVPPETRAALTSHRQPKIYLLGPTSVIGPKVETALRKLGKVTRIQGPDPVSNAIAFARFSDGTFGWGVVDPGHGLVFAGASEDPQTAAAAAPLSASGTFGPLLLVGDAGKVDKTLGAYLLDIQPGYAKDPDRWRRERAVDRRAVADRPPAGDLPRQSEEPEPMSQAEHPERLGPEHEVTVEDIRQLMGASTPHFALQIRNRIARLISDLPEDHPARVEGEREIERLTRLGYTGEVRGHEGEEGLPPLPSVSDAPDPQPAGNLHG
jgi:hypothetical protein